MGILEFFLFLNPKHRYIMSEIRIFKRKIYDRMLQWKQERDGKTALLVKGARRVGKSTIVEEFARQEYETYMFIDFSRASEEVKSLFNDLMDLDYIFLRLQTIYNVISSNSFVESLVLYSTLLSLSFFSSLSTPRKISMPDINEKRAVHVATETTMDFSSNPPNNSFRNTKIPNRKTIRRKTSDLEKSS